MRVPRSKFDPRSTAVIFVGYHWNPGQTWSGDYYVSPVVDLTVHGRTSPRVIRIKGGLVIDEHPWTFPIKSAERAALREALVQRHVHELVHHLPAAAPDEEQGEPDDDMEALDHEQQFWSEADDPIDFEDAPVPDVGVVDESLLGLDANQRARRLQDDAGNWPARRGSSRPPYIDPDSWQSFSHAIRLELAREYRDKTRADTAPQLAPIHI